MQHPDITGKWQQADPSTHTLELSPTNREDVFAIRDTYDQSDVVFATGKQILNLAESVQKGTIRNLVR